MASTVRPDLDSPGLHPDPPEELRSLALPLKLTSRSWLRSYLAEHDPLFFGRTGRHRFDAPGGEFGTLYVGADEHCVFLETFGHRTGEVDFVTLGALAAGRLARIKPRRRLRLVDLTGSGLARLRADARLCTDSTMVSRKWALALFEHPERPDGLYYRSRHDPDRYCAALFDRASEEIEAVTLGSFADAANAPILANILETYHFGLIDDG